MPLYSFSLEDHGFAIRPLDSAEDFADDEAAMNHARAISNDFAGSTIAQGRSVVVRDATEREVGRVLTRNGRWQDGFAVR
jgi:hypothetical protein